MQIFNIESNSSWFCYGIYILSANILVLSGLVDRVLTLHAGSRGFDSHRGHMSEQFFRSNRPGYPHPVSSELELVVSEWRSVIAVSLNVGGGVRLIKPAKLYMCTQTLQTQRGRTHGAGCVRQWFRTAEPLGERRYENWNTHTHSIVCLPSRKKLVCKTVIPPGPVDANYRSCMLNGGSLRA